MSMSKPGIKEMIKASVEEVTSLLKENKVFWPKTSKPFHNTPQKKEKLTSLIKGLDWKSIPEEFVPGMVINEVIQKFEIPKVSHASISMKHSAGAVIGIRGNFTQGPVDLIILIPESCTKAIPLCTIPRY